MSKPEASAENQPKEKPVEKPVKRTREDKHRKKDYKNVDHVFKALSGFENTEEKLGAMCQKYAEILNDHRMLQNAAKLMEKKNSILQREKEQLQAEHNKAILTRSRLENLCRELQRQNKAIKDESITAMREEEEKKREVAAMFHSKLTELGNLVSKNNEKNNKLRDDNLDMSTKLKSVCEEYEKKEQHVEKLAKQLELEMQLTEAKLAKAKMEMAIERDTINREKQQLLLEVTQYKAAMEEHKGTEQGLRQQIQMYNDKYDEFHKALIQSNEAIGGFKQEMERMSKQITRLEKETMSWRTRYEMTHKSLLQMTDEKLKADQNACVSFRRLTALQGLCRKLQAQCNFLREELKKHGGSEESNDKNEKSEDNPTNDPEYEAQIERHLNAVDAAISDSAPCPIKISMVKTELQNGEVKEVKESENNTDEQKIESNESEIQDKSVESTGSEEKLDADKGGEIDEVVPLTVPAKEEDKITNTNDTVESEEKKPEEDTKPEEEVKEEVNKAKEEVNKAKEEETVKPQEPPAQGKKSKAKRKNKNNKS